ncbi:MAG: hypothetical protein INR65_15625 [Gluconacetobacter diazotrophicus]|nr:hypothetical protein [Gluconacetobacter diazotrophicus]
MVRRVVTALAAGLAILLLGRLGVLNRLAPGLAPAGLNWTNDYQLVEYLRGRVVDDGLTKTRKDCLLFIINGNDPPDAVRMRVMEKHSGSCPPAAPGADALPQLFTLQVDRQNKSVQTDAGDPGHFHPLP